MAQTADTSRLAQVAMQIGMARQNAGFQEQQIKMAQSQALSGAINNALRGYLSIRAQQAERERVGFARRAIELREREFEQMRPLHEARLARAKTEEERAAFQMEFEQEVAPLRKEMMGMQIEERYQRTLRTQMEQDLLSDRIANDAQTAIDRHEAHQADMVLKGGEWDEQKQEWVFNPEKVAKMMGAQRGTHLQEYQKTLQAVPHLQVLGSPLGTPLPGGGAVDANSKLMARAELERLKFPHEQVVWMDRFAEVNRGKQQLQLLYPSGQQAISFADHNVRPDNWAETYGNEADAARRYAIQHGLSGTGPAAEALQKALQQSGRNVAQFRTQFENLRREIIAPAPAGGMLTGADLARFGQEQAARGDAASKFAKDAETATFDLRKLLVDALQEKNKNWVWGGYFKPMTVEQERPKDVGAPEAPPGFAPGRPAPAKGIAGPVGVQAPALPSPTTEIEREFATRGPRWALERIADPQARARMERGMEAAAQRMRRAAAAGDETGRAAAAKEFRALLAKLPPPQKGWDVRKPGAPVYGMLPWSGAPAAHTIPYTGPLRWGDE